MAGRDRDAAKQCRPLKNRKATTEHKNKSHDVRQGSHLDGLTAVLGGTGLVRHTWRWHAVLLVLRRSNEALGDSRSHGRLDFMGFIMRKTELHQSKERNTGQPI